MVYKFCFCFLVCFFYLSLLHANAQSVSEQQKINDIIEPQLDLTINLIEQRYCSKSAVLFRLKLTFTNAGGIPILFYKDSKIIWKEIVKGVGNNSLEKLHKIEPFISLTSVIKFEELPNRNSFTILKKGESFKLELNHALFITDKDTVSKDNIHSGEYSLEIRVGTWYYHPNLKQGYQKKWQNEGYLWTKNITSAPMEFSIKKPDERTIESCTSK